MSERIEWIRDRDRLAALAAQWDQLATGPFAPFLRSGWTQAWWDAFGGGRELRTCALWREGRLAGVFPLFSDGRRRLEAMANTHSPAFLPVAVDRAALAALIEAVMQASSELTVGALPEGDPVWSSLVERSAALGRVGDHSDWHVSPLVDTSGGADQYRDERKRQLREVERRRRKLLREHRAEMSLISTPDDLEHELREGLELEASGWKGRAATAVLSAADTTRFYTSVARLLHPTGELRFSSLRVDGRLAGFDFAVLHDSRYFLLKTAFDEQLRSLAPGLSLRLAVVEQCFESGLAAHEFLGGDLEWKRLFSTGERRLLTYQGYAKTPGALLRLARRRSRRAATPLARRLLRRGGRSDRAVS